MIQCIKYTFKSGVNCLDYGYDLLENKLLKQVLIVIFGRRLVTLFI